MNEGELVLVVGALLAAGLAASLAAGRLRVPGLVLVLLLGMLIGSDGLGLIDFGEEEHHFELASQAGLVALALHPVRGRPVVGLRRDPARGRHLDRAGHARHGRRPPR